MTCTGANGGGISRLSGTRAGMGDKGALYCLKDRQKPYKNRYAVQVKCRSLWQGQCFPKNPEKDAKKAVSQLKQPLVCTDIMMAMKL